MGSLLELALCIKAAQRELERRANDVMRPLALTGAQADALTVIRHSQPISLKELGELLIAEAGHPSRLVDRLVAQGLVERRQADDDRRRIVLSLTAEGRQVERRAERARQDLYELAETLIGDRDVDGMLEFLREMLRYSAYAELLERRREMLDAEPNP